MATLRAGGVARTDSELLAATHGRGAYSLELPPAAGRSQPPPETSPSAKLKKIKKVKLGKKSKIKGSATDEAGRPAVKLKFGDGKKKTLKLKPKGKFKRQAPLREARASTR